jgi:hypothetical protein
MKRIVLLGLLVLTSLPTSCGTSSKLPPTLNVERRDELTFDELMADEHVPDSPIHNDYFAPVGEAAPALHAFEGTLVIGPGMAQVETLPDFGGERSQVPVELSVEFFTYENYLVPVERGIPNEDQPPESWDFVFSPGSVWSEPGDRGMSRASFPFTLLSRDSNYPRGQNGVATFLYDEATVSALYLQVTQEINAHVQFDLWGQLPAVYSPGPVTSGEALAARFAQELAQQMEIRPWVELKDQYHPGSLSGFTDGLAPEEISATGVVVDDVLYLHSCMTRYGECPYPRYMRHHVYSVSKSMGNLIAMLRLAQNYGDQVFDLRIVDYVDVTADHHGWEQVTFRDALNMAVGVGNGSHSRNSLDIYADDQPDDKSFWLAQTAREKLDVAFSADNHPWGPGEMARYVNPHALVLSAAIDSFLKSQEGPDAHLWDMLTEEVFEAIGVYHLPMLHTIERDGSQGVPIMLLGLYPTVEDTAKVTMLLQNGGRHGDEQLLSPTMLEEALYRRGVAGLPTGKRFRDGDQAYHMSFWGHPYRAQNGRYFQVPYMQGHGGNSVVLAPNGVSSFRFTDAHNYGVEPLVRAAEAIRPFSDGGEEPVWLVPN